MPSHSSRLDIFENVEPKEVDVPRVPIFALQPTAPITLGSPIQRTPSGETFASMTCGLDWR